MPGRPIYLLSDELSFPPAEWARADGLLAVGGDLSIERLVLAYRSGIFPWPIADGDGDEAPLLWWAPAKRAIIQPAELHVGRSLRKVVRRGDFEVRYDTAFAEVIRACSLVPRPGQAGTWLIPEMIEAYTQLHEAGFAHSVESWQGGELCGGLYGVSLGGCFFGESMFARRDDASKVAFVTLAERLAEWDFDLIDCQLQNDHLLRFGVYQIPKLDFMRRLAKSLEKPTRRGAWT
jgi:leucyl/phenylalanyl-tRNA--protein transferase